MIKNSYKEPEIKLTYFSREKVVTTSAAFVNNEVISALKGGVAELTSAEILSFHF